MNNSTTQPFIWTLISALLCSPYSPPPLRYYQHEYNKYNEGEEDTDVDAGVELQAVVFLHHIRLFFGLSVCRSRISSKNFVDRSWGAHGVIRSGLRLVKVGEHFFLTVYSLK